MNILHLSSSNLFFSLYDGVIDELIAPWFVFQSDNFVYNAHCCYSLSDYDQFNAPVFFSFNSCTDQVAGLLCSSLQMLSELGEYLNHPNLHQSLKFFACILVKTIQRWSGHTKSEALPKKELSFSPVELIGTRDHKLNITKSLIRDLISICSPSMTTNSFYGINMFTNNYWQNLTKV